MSEKKEDKSESEGKKKGGSKMPVIAVVALVLAGGGFFMMKGKGDGKPKVKKIELGEPITLKEILVNLKGSDTYLKTEIALQPIKEFKKEEIEKNAPLINDAIIVRLKSKTIEQLNSPEDLAQLKREIAEDVNAVLPKEEKKDEKEKTEEGSEEGKKPADAESSDEKKTEEGTVEKSSDGEMKTKLSDGKKKGKTPKKPKDSKFDSDKGPVMKVLFNSFCTQ